MVGVWREGPWNSKHCGVTEVTSREVLNPARRNRNPIKDPRVFLRAFSHPMRVESPLGRRTVKGFESIRALARARAIG